MRISRVYIRNFRNFSSLDLVLGKNAVIVGENKIGKSNFLHAIRLVLDPSLPDSARKLRDEDFWDGLPRPLKRDDRIIVSVDIADFEENENQTSLLADHLVETEPMVARLTYSWHPLAHIDGDPTKEADYEFSVYGGDRPENIVQYEVRRRLPLESIQALRDCESDLAKWSRSPLRPLLDKVAGNIDKSVLSELADGLDEATYKIASVKAIKSIADSIREKLLSMVGASQALDTVLRYSPADPEKLIRALRIFIDNGRREMADASLGSANVLYFALKLLEYELLVEDGDRDHTFLSIEEPESHLHPTLQRLIFRNYLAMRADSAEKNNLNNATVLITTHSPHIASVTPLSDFVFLKRTRDGKSTEAVSASTIELAESDYDDIERYIDVNRGEVLFSKGVILVEGDAEKYLVPILAAKQGYDLDELGVAVCSVSGTNFSPYLIFFGPKGLGMPLVALTDDDPQGDEASLGAQRVINQMMVHIISPQEWEDASGDEILDLAPQNGVFLNDHTFEVDLFKAGLGAEFAAAMTELDPGKAMTKRMQAWSNTPASLDVERFLKDIESIGKGRFAQRLASVISRGSNSNCPEYIVKGLAYISEKCSGG